MKRLKRKISDSNYSKTLDREERLLYKKAIKQIEETNRRLKKLERGIDLNKAKYNPKTKRWERTGNIVVLENGKKRTIKTTNYLRAKSGTWATKKLSDKLGSLYNKKTNKISMPVKFDKASLRAIIKATNNFLNSQTSTLEGIKKVQDKTKETIRNIIDNPDNINNFTDNDVETLYNFWNDSDWQDITQYIPPSDLYVIMMDSESDTDFLSKIEMYIDKDSLYGDADMKDKLVNIYHKFR